MRRLSPTSCLVIGVVSIAVILMLVTMTQLLTSLQRQAGNLTTLMGVVTTEIMVVLPQDAIIRVVLLNVSIHDAPELVIQKVVIPNPGQKPIPFGVPYYPSSIIETRSYALRSEIGDQNGDTMFVTSVDYLVITQGRPVQGITLLLDYVVKGMIMPIFNRIN